MKKVSITLEDEVEKEARARVADGEFSAFVNDAVKRALQAVRLQELLDEFEAERGPIPPEVQAEVDALLWPT
jgi:Arc/MetJ-type ribon-helix-helix transcriptional regulator